MGRSVLALAVAVAVAASTCRAAYEPDLITSLPGWDGALPTKQYSGYLNISATRRMHYWFVESETDPANAPTVMWLNGGPGCSSLDGFIYEHGPFRLNASNSAQLLPFEYRWNRVANMLYLESPVGVGFSYSSNPADYKCTDDTAASDNILSVEKFFSEFPEYKKNDLFITGESYAGIYVPTLAEAIMWAMGNGTYTGAPLKGIAVGNGCSGNAIGVCGGQRDQYDTEYLLQTAFVDFELKAQIRAECDWTNNEPSAKCQELVSQMHDSIGNIDLYNMYGPCISGSAEHLAGSGSGHYKAPLGDSRFRGPDACIDSILASEYFNRADVQAAIHVRKPEQHWATCGSEPGWSYQSTRPNLPRDTYPSLVKHFRVVIYNGDWDACVPHTDNDAWTRSMKYDVVDPWHPWMYTLDFEGKTSQQVGGYAINYAHNFSFITVRGGRHEVPETAPDKALSLIQHMIGQKPF